MKHTAIDAARIDVVDDAIAARTHAHRANLERYARLLATELTQTERDYIHRRMREERLALETLARGDFTRGARAPLGSKGIDRRDFGPGIPAA